MEPLDIFFSCRLFPILMLLYLCLFLSLCFHSVWFLRFFFYFFFCTLQDEELGRSILTLTNALQKDSGDFSCLVVNAAGSAEGNFTLEVLAPPPFPFPTLDTSHILIISLGLLGLLLLLSACVLITFWRRRVRRQSHKPPEILATSTPIKPPRINYDINPGSLVPNGYSKTKADSTDNPDLILETNNSGSYQVSHLKLLIIT